MKLTAAKEKFDKLTIENRNIKAKMFLSEDEEEIKIEDESNDINSVQKAQNRKFQIKKTEFYQKYFTINVRLPTDLTKANEHSAVE